MDFCSAHAGHHVGKRFSSYTIILIPANNYVDIAIDQCGVSGPSASQLIQESEEEA